MSNLIKCSGKGDLNDLNSNSNSTGCIKAALVAGLYPNILRLDKKNNRLINEKETKLKLSYNSVLWSELLKSDNQVELLGRS